MDDTQLNDLKQFITATVSQQTANLATKDDIAVLKTDLEDANLKLDTIMGTMGNQLVDYETRLTRLESAKA